MKIGYITNNDSHHTLSITLPTGFKKKQETNYKMGYFDFGDNYEGFLLNYVLQEERQKPTKSAKS